MSSEATVAGIVGAITATIGTLLLWLTQILFEHLKKATDETARRTAIAHKAMLTLDAQWSFTEAINYKIDEYMRTRATVEDIPSIHANHASLPRVPLDEIGFLSDYATNKNILPTLLGVQQRFDQLIDILNRSAEERRALHFTPRGQQYYSALRACLVQSEIDLTQLINRVLGEYPGAVSILEAGLKESIKEFQPVYKRK